VICQDRSKETSSPVSGTGLTVNNTVPVVNNPPVSGPGLTVNNVVNYPPASREPDPVNVGRVTESPPTGLSGRHALPLKETVIPKGTINLKSLKMPSGSCRDEVMQLSSLPNFNKLDKILEDCISWLESFKWAPEASTHDLTHDEMFAVHLYTHDLRQYAEHPENNFFNQLNAMLRQRNSALMEKWSGYLYYFLTALHKITPVTATLYRGVGKEAVGAVPQYVEKRPIQWSGFTSTTPRLEKAMEFARDGGVVFCMKVIYGRDISMYSLFPEEEEIVLSPNSKFVVSKAVYLRNGIHFVEMEETQEAYIF